MQEQLVKHTAACLALAGMVLLSSTLARAEEPKPNESGVSVLERLARETGALQIQLAPNVPWIGASCKPVGGTLRSQLKLDGGLVVENVTAKGPAASAGIQKHDILLRVGDAKLGKLGDLVEAVQRAKGKEVTVKLLRAGQEKSLKVKPVKPPEKGLLGVFERKPNVVILVDDSLSMAIEPQQKGLSRFEQALKEATKLHGGAVIISDAPANIPFRKSLRISITKSGETPAKVVVERDGKRWEVTDKELDKLPEKVRPHVRRLLGREPMFNFRIEGPAEAALGDLVGELRSLGLQITADKKTIDAATSEAAYFMFAGRRDFRPRCKPLKLSEDKNWLDGKPVFATKAKKQKIHPLFVKLVKQMGYNEVCVYAADVYYGVNNHAKFSLYKLGYRKDDKRKGRGKEILLGDAGYVINLK